MEVTLFGEEAIVQLKSVGEVENSIDRPGRDLDRECGIEPWNRRDEVPNSEAGKADENERTL